MHKLIKYPVVDEQKECGVCHEVLPVSMFRPVKNHYESLCQPCKKKYAAEYRQREEVKKRTRQYHVDYKKNPENRIRSNENHRKYSQKTDAKLNRNTNRRAWALNEKLKAIEYKGGKCVLCGYNTYPGGLDFHHINPEEKDGLKAHWTFERNIPELDRCILLCCRCHREVHAGLHPNILEK